MYICMHHRPVSGRISSRQESVKVKLLGIVEISKPF